MTVNMKGIPWYCAVHSLGNCEGRSSYTDVKSSPTCTINGENEYMYLYYEDVRVCLCVQNKIQNKTRIRPYFFFKCPLDFDHSQGEALLSQEHVVIAPLNLLHCL